MLIEELRKRSDYIHEKSHDTLPLLIWNYNNKCAIENAWDEFTLQARGLITDLEGNIIARPLQKFFNLNQRIEDSMANLPTSVPKIYEKLDGSMCSQYYDGDKVCVATRGSFNSEQAIYATKLLEKFVRSDFNSKYTYIYELITSWNRVVVNYGNRDELVLLAIIDTQTGEEGDFIAEARRLGFSYPKTYNHNINELLEIIKTLPGDDEGFVVKYQHNYRVKIKGVEYLRLHRLITGFSTKSIWECLMNDTSFDDSIKDVPDEFFKWVLLKKCELMDQFNNVLVKVYDAYKLIDLSQNRKEQAIWIIGNHKDISSELFALLDGQKPDKMIWRKLKPVYELPFLNQSEP